MTDASGALHPDVNALADLAADVLPVEEARAVEAHVIACPDCADLLADSERIRPLLLSDDVGPMPEDVWARLSGALSEEASVRSALGGHVVPMSPVPAPAEAPWDQHWQVDRTPDEASDTQWWAAQGEGWERSPLEPGPAAPPVQPLAAAPAEPAATDGPPTARRRREAADRHDAGRDRTWDETEVWTSFDLRAAREPAPPTSSGAPASGTSPGLSSGPDGGDDATGLTRISRPLADLSPDLSPAGASAERPVETTSTLSALGGGRVSGLRRPGRAGGPSRRDVRDSSRSENGVGSRLRGATSGRRGPLLAAAAGIVIAAGIGGVLWSSLSGNGTSTTPGGEQVQVSFPPVSAPVLATGKNYSEAGLAAEGQALAKQAAGQKPGFTAPSNSATLGSTELSKPKVLAACLDALNAKTQQPLAVDLAQYKNREAAIIVLSGQDGGIEVWAVSRDCGSGDDTPFTFVSVPKG